MKKKITEARLRDVGHHAARRVVKDMADRLEVSLSDDTLKCIYVGTAEEDAPLNSRTRILYEWRLPCGGVIKTNTSPMQILHQRGGTGPVPPTVFKKFFLMSCLPMYLDHKRSLPCLAQVAEVRCHHVAQPRPVINYKVARIQVKGTTSEVILCAHLDEDMYLAAPPASKDKYMVITATDTEEMSLKRPNPAISFLLAKARGTNRGTHTTIFGISLRLFKNASHPKG